MIKPILTASQLFLFLILFTIVHPLSAQQGPPGFETAQYGQRLPGRSLDLDFDASNRMYTCEKAGRVYVTINGIRANNPLIDLREEVDNSSDRGLLSLELDPNFSLNGYVYLSYVMDRHHLFYYGTPTYDADVNDMGATILRVTRYTVSPQSLTATNPNQMSVVPGSRLVLLGESKSTSAPVLDGSHAGGDLAFGADGSLLVATGDGAGLNGRDVGGKDNPGYGSNYWQQALDDGIMTFRENVGSYRSQLLDSHCGKILRLDPATGNGLPSNPYFDPAHPRSARSRVFARGLRNPYRMSMRPGTGSTNPAVGQPGSLYIGDVGWNRYEEVHVMKRAGQNFGWPFFEGSSFVEGRSEFYVVPPNKIVNASDSSQNIYYNALPDPSDSLALFSKPELAIGHQQQGVTYLQHGVQVKMPDLNLPYANITNGSTAIIDGGWTSRVNTLPEAYRNKYFFSDYSRGWISCINVDDEDNILEVKHFGQEFNNIIGFTVNPNNAKLYMFYGFTIDPFQVSYTSNQPPVARAQADRQFGPGPLAVRFNGSTSYDPEKTALTYVWTFGDGATSTLPSPTHSYTALGVQTYTATLTVTDAGGASAQQAVVVSVNNTPPAILSTSLDNLTLLSATTTTSLALSAVVSDQEHAGNQLTYRWQVIEQHNDHGHPEADLTTPTASVVVPPLGTCSGLETYWYRVVLTVTDAAGLSTTVTRDLYPDCGGMAQTITFPTPGRRAVSATSFQPVVWSSSGLPVMVYVVEGPAYMQGEAVYLTGRVGRVVLRAVQSGGNLFRPATAVERAFEVVNSTTADLSLQLAFNRRVGSVDSTVKVMLTVANSGPDAVSNVLINSQLPTNLSFVSSPSMTYQNGVVSGMVAVSTGFSQTLEMTLKPRMAGHYRLSAELASTDTFDPDSQAGSGTGDGEDDQATADLRTIEASTANWVSPNPGQVPLPPLQRNQPSPVANRVDLSLSLQVSSRTPAVGQPLTITATVANAGSLTATNVVVRDTLRYLTLSLPSALSVVATGTDYVVVEATFARVLPQQSAVMVFVVRPTKTGPGRTAAQVWSVGGPGPNLPVDADSVPGNGVGNGEDDCAWLDWRVR
ncbi:PQQ-dependent sugar dehydrogenase [Fibrella sp. HMF5335]|uniref:PQQ-dependent sugar dehydrogenase n=1 Tax=Fibrella rubiginis TaxID=2817060 RepID=A0A939GAR6_9BACT|nr:PKD domain-containing protein [Fibrella rubiginis]MBO0934936.1 PQQ-dependent sugar dehydrogenase [Fibrella rubiginis]